MRIPVQRWPVLFLLTVGLCASGIASTASGGPAEQKPVRKTYDVGKLVQNRGDVSVLIELVAGSIDPQGWSEMGGVGQIQVKKKGKLDVTQTPAVHAQIAELFGGIQKLPPFFKSSDKKTKNPKGTKRPATPNTKVKPGEKVKPAEKAKPLFEVPVGKKDPNGNRVVIYYVKDLLRRGGDVDPLIETIVTKVTPDNWEEVGGTGTINPFLRGGALVIRQSEKGHKQLHELLGKMRKK